MEKQIVFKINEDKHKEIKLHVAMNGITIKDFILSLVDKELNKGK